RIPYLDTEIWKHGHENKTFPVSLSPYLPVLLSPFPPCVIVCAFICLIEIQIYRRRHAKAQFVRRIFHKDAHFVNKTRPQLLGLHRFWRELGDRRYKSDPSLEAAPGKAVDHNTGKHSGMDLA